MQRSARIAVRRAVSGSIPYLISVLLLTACQDATEMTSPRPTLIGVVRSASTGQPIAGAEVKLGASTSITDHTGRYFFIHLIPGAGKLEVNAAGFDSLTMPVMVTSAEVVQNIDLNRITLFDQGEFSVYVPDVPRITAVLVTLGGPDTRGFSAGTAFGAPLPEVEASLQSFGQKLRGIAQARGIAILGTSKAAMADEAGSDKLIVDALDAVAKKSGYGDLASLPILLYGLSGGGPEASGFAARNPQIVAGLFLKSPLDVEILNTAAARAVPTFVVLAEFDTFVDNSAIQSAFNANRKSGGLWGLAIEAGVPHHFLTPNQQLLTSNWMIATLKARVAMQSIDPNFLESPPSSGLGGLVPYPEALGWLGNHVTGEIGAWGDYRGDPSSASWFPSQAVAENWRAFRQSGQ